MKNRADEQVATIIAGWCWLAMVVIVLLCSCTARGAIGTTTAYMQPAVCRVLNQLQGMNNVGSGTLIDKTDQGREGLVLTCAHLFREGVGNVVVEFADGRTHGARLVAIDRQADLAALAIANPRVEPAAVCFTVRQQTQLRACGYGANGKYRCAVGPNVGYAESTGQLSLLIGDRVRSGDSGGGVFDDQGRLVAVVWGEAQGVTYASYGKPLRRFLSRALGRRAPVVQTCPDGVCPPQRPIQIAPTPQRPVDPGSGEHSIVADGRWRELNDRIGRLEKTKQDRGDYLTRADLDGYLRSGDLSRYVRLEDLNQFKSESTQRYAAVLDRIRLLGEASGGSLGHAAGKAAVGFLGLSGPAGWGILGATTIGGWLIGRHVRGKRRAESRKPKAENHLTSPACGDRRKQEGSAADASVMFQETHQPIERDDDEARQLLRLSQLEGRDPLQDAVAGRLALDRLDTIADGDSDSDKACWADQLRRELRERFNEIAPTKFTV